MTQMPPTRYRVVERGRRLEVIDTWTDRRGPPKPAAGPGPSPFPASLPPAPERPAPGRAPDLKDAARPATGRREPMRPGAPGSRALTTARWYDAKGPRAIVLDAEGAQRFENAQAIALAVVVVVLVIGFFWWPLWVAPVVLLLNAKARAAGRSAIARWLDARAQRTSGGGPSSGG